MLHDQLDLVRVDDFRSVRIALASPEDILSWSSGEVTRPDTINYRTHRPEKGGLFCERIFGPERDWECGCGKYKGLKFKGLSCERCGIQVSHSRVRRKRMGHIELATPVVHIWFFKGVPSVLGQLLQLKRAELERVIYCQSHVILEGGKTGLRDGAILDDTDLLGLRPGVVGQTRPGKPGSDPAQGSGRTITPRSALRRASQTAHPSAWHRRGPVTQPQSAKLDGSAPNPGYTAGSSACRSAFVGELCL
jgi:DNA-directed RNA polymerase beta' subunit